MVPVEGTLFDMINDKPVFTNADGTENENPTQHFKQYDPKLEPGHMTDNSIEVAIFAFFGGGGRQCSCLF